MKGFSNLNRRQKTAWLIAGAVVALAVTAGIMLLGSNRQVVLNSEAPTCHMPEVDAVAPLAPLGDSRAERTRSIVIYHADENYQKLTTSVRDVTVTSDSSLAEAVVSSVLEASAANDGNMKDIQLLSLEVSRRVATVNLSIDARMLEPEKLHVLRAAIVNSLLEISEIDYVNVLINDREECILQLPAGAMSRFEGDLGAMWLRSATEQARYERSEQGGFVLERYMTLYFGAADGEYILPEVRAVRIDDGDYLGAVITQQLRGPDDSAVCTRLLPFGSAYLRRKPEIVMADDGNRIAVISFDGSMIERMEHNGVSTALAMGALTRSICTFVPEIDGVLCDVDGATLTELHDSRGRLAYTFSDGIMRRSDFDSLVGDVGRLYYPSDDYTSLRPVNRAMSRHDADSPRARLRLLMENPNCPHARRAMPDGVTDADVLGVRVENGQVLINLSGAFYQACEGMSVERARALVYSMVDTMCELSGIKSVRFYFDGEQVDYLAGAICLRGPLLGNVGIVRGKP